MRKAIIPLSLFLILVSVHIINGWLPLVNEILQLNLDFPGQYSYLIIIFTYLAVLAVLLLEKDNLSVFNFDRPSLLILVLFGVVRVNLFVPNESWYKTIIATLGLTLLLICIVQWKKIPNASARWAMIGVVASSIAIPIALVEMLQVEKYAQTMYEKNFTGTLIRNLIFQLSFIAPFEEITYRGILWGQLRKWNISENKIFWIQLIPFWLMHFDQIFTISSPLILLAGIALSLLTRHSKQIFPSIIAHTLSNLLIPILVWIFLR